ncbi:MAG: site-2 protease family protein [Spirochaetales bacterium]
MIVNILIGLVGLGIVVFIHELGHLVAAKAVGIEVEAFSLGWGKKLIGYTWRGTEYRISVFPVGGYCKMKGEQSYAAALDNDEQEIPEEEGSFFTAAPWKRIVTLLAGPLSNLVLAILILSVIWWFGFTTETFPNRVILASDYPELEATEELQGDGQASPSPADSAGIESGDYVISIAGQEVDSYGEIQQIIAQNALTELDVILERNGRRIATTVTPELTPETGSGYIGVYAWVEPVIAQVQAGTPAAIAGLEPGDRIVSINGVDTPHSLAVGRALSESGSEAQIMFERDVSMRESIAPLGEQEMLGVAFETVSIPTPDLNVFEAIGQGATEGFRILSVSVRSLRLLFQGVELRSAVAGPVRISYFIGDVATSGFAVGVDAGFRSFFNFLALLSVVLFFMNLLPIPVLDGGQIVLSGVEWVRNKKPKPKTVHRYQMVGGVIVIGLLFFAVFGDILFLAGR